MLRRGPLGGQAVLGTGTLPMALGIFYILYKITKAVGQYTILLKIFLLFNTCSIVLLLEFHLGEYLKYHASDYVFMVLKGEMGSRQLVLASTRLVTDKWAFP